MAEGKVTLKPGIGMGCYDVFLDGVLVGEVRKKVTHYNLRRKIVVTEWYGTTVERVRVPERSGYNTRRDAVSSLVKAVQS